MHGIKKLVPLFTSILLTFSMLLFSSCSSDSDEDTERAKLIGTWSLESLNIDLMFGDKPFRQYLQDKGVSEDEIQAAEEFFMSDIENSIQDNDLVLKQDNTYITGQEVGTWSYDASRKVINIKVDDFNNFDYQVKSVSSTTLVLLIEQMNAYHYDHFRGGLGDIEIDESINVVLEVTLSKS